MGIILKFIVGFDPPIIRQLFGMITVWLMMEIINIVSMPFLTAMLSKT